MKNEYIMEKSFKSNLAKSVAGILASTLILLYILYSKEESDILSLILIAFLGVIVGSIYVQNYKHVILISGLVSYCFVAIEIITKLMNLWPIELVFSLFIIIGPYYLGAYLSSHYYMRKTINED